MPHPASDVLWTLPASCHTCHTTGHTTYFIYCVHVFRPTSTGTQTHLGVYCSRPCRDAALRAAPLHRIDRKRKGRRRSSVHTLGFSEKITDTASLEIFKMQLNVTGRWLLVQRPTYPGTLNNLVSFFRPPQSRPASTDSCVSSCTTSKSFQSLLAGFPCSPPEPRAFPYTPIFSSLPFPFDRSQQQTHYELHLHSHPRPYVNPPSFPHPSSSAYPTLSLCDRRQRRVELLSLEQ